MAMQGGGERAHRTTGTWLDDEPIRTGEDDLLGRRPFARQVAQILNEAGKRAPSTVVGLAGPWGSGKTSTVWLIRESLGNSIPWRVQELNPWGLNGAEAVIAEVLAAVTSALPSRAAKKARKALSRYAAFATPLVGMAPIAGTAAKQVADVVAARLAGEQTLAGQAAEVERELKRLAQPVLVIVDDIDRLQPPELLALFKAVRLLGRLPHVHYLLSYDPRTMIELITSTAIAEKNPERAAAFMEKLINVRVTQPPIRPDQVRAIYDSRMRVALADLKVELSQAAQLRLEDEHELLLAAVLREPRSIGRFFAQLYTYIPLLGADEIDLSDFIGLTLIRTAAPSLYERLATERHILTGAESIDWERPMGEWGDGLTTIFNDLEVAPSLQDPIAETLRTLFPGLGRQTDDAAQRTRDLRISDDDYIDRYFALTLPSEELTDATIRAVLQDWSGLAPSATASNEFVEVLAAELDTPAAYAQADSAVRRAAAKSSELDADSSAALVAKIISVLPSVCVPTRRLVVDWLADTVRRSRPLDAGHLLMQLDRDVKRESVLFLVLQAFRRVVTTTLPPASPPNWVLDISRSLTRAGLDRYCEQLKLGDNAPREAAFGYLLYAERALGAEEVRARLMALIDEGQVGVADLAARFVSTGQYTDSFREFITDFNPDDVGLRIGWDRIEASQHELPEAAAIESIPLNEGDVDYDVSWANLRRHAARGLLSRLGSAQSAQLPRIREVDDATVNAISNRGGDILNATQADFELTATLFAPAISLVPLADLDDAGSTDDIAPRWLATLGRHQLANTIRAAVDTWHAEGGEWHIADSDGARYQHATMTLTSRLAGNEDEPNRPPVVIAGVWAQMQPETVRPQGGLSRVVSVGVGFWIAGLDDHRRRTNGPPMTHPLPAALQFDEAWSWATTILRAVALPDYRLIGIPDSSDVVLNLTGRTGRGLDNVLDLRGLRRDTARSMSQVSVAVSSPAADREEAHQREAVADPDLVVAQLFRKWLNACGYRQFENAMAAASGRFRHQLARDPD